MDRGPLGKTKNSTLPASQESIDLEPYKNLALSFPGSYLPELRGLTDLFSRKHDPLETLDISQAMALHPLSKKLYEGSFQYPDKVFYQEYEDLVLDPHKPLGRQTAEVNKNLLQCLSQYFGEKPVGNTVCGWSARATLLYRGDMEIYFKINKKQIYENHGVKISGAFYYPPGGYREWHNNSRDSSGWRLYYVRVSEENKSWFHYVNPDTDELVQIPDRDDSINLFYLAGQGEVNAGLRKDFFWHNVVSHTHRRSLGMRVPEKLVLKLIQNHPGLSSLGENKK